MRNSDLLSRDITPSLGRDVASLWEDAGVQKIWSLKVYVYVRPYMYTWCSVSLTTATHALSYVDLMLVPRLLQLRLGAGGGSS